MKKQTIKRIVCAILCAVIAGAFAGCGAQKAESVSVNIREKLKSLMVTDQALGVAGKYTKLSDIADGSIDPDVLGTWISADGETTYSYAKDGAAKSKSATYGDTEVKFTCITVGEYKILCEESDLSPEYYDDAQPGDTQLTYLAYSVENDAMYQVVVEEENEDYTTSISSLVTMFRVDASGSAAAAIEKNPIDLKALDGTWASDKGSFTIENGTLTLGEDSFTISFDDKNQFVVDKDGQSTVYRMAVSVMKEYDYEDRTQYAESTAMGISCSGTGENDKPNLLPVLTDYKAEFNYDSWYYSGSFKLQDAGSSES